MQLVSIILGRRVPCNHCGQTVRLVLLPTMSTSKWQVCEDFAGKPDGYIELHDCEMHPNRTPLAAHAEGPPNGRR